METHIDKAKYEGYLWLSDRQTPEVYDGTRELDFTFDDTQNPFVVEGYLWDANRNVSYMVKFADGKYYVCRTEVTGDELRSISDTQAGAHGDVATTVKEYVTHRIPIARKLRFLQYWKAETDPMCCGMKVLQPWKRVFTGFIRKED